MPFRSFVPLLVLAVGACTDSDHTAASASAEASAEAGGASAAVSATGDGARSVSQDTDLISYQYSYPAAAGNIPALARILDRQGDRARDETIAEAREARRAAEANGFPYRKHSFQEEWKVVADLPGWLSLSGDFATYSGGAHGMYGRESLVWDKRAGRSFPASELFRSTAILGDALGDKVCDALDRERAERRGEQVAEGSEDIFDQCVGVEEATLFVGSSNGRTFDRIGVWFGPYVAGPYVEGGYELTFPADAAILDAVKPAYRSAFAIAR